MNTILFWDTKNTKARRIKVAQSKVAVDRGDGVTRRQAFEMAKRNGWVHITTRTKLSELGWERI